MYLITQVLADIKDLKIKHVIPSENIPKGTDIVVTTQAESKYINFDKVFIPKAFNRSYLYSNIYLIAHSKKRFQQINIGIDPGKRTGFAALANNNLILKTGEYESALEVVKAVIEVYFNIEAEQFRIKIGNRGGSVGEEIRNRLNKIFSQKLIILTVPEKHTTKGKILKEFSKNINSAILIAQK